MQRIQAKWLCGLAALLMALGSAPARAQGKVGPQGAEEGPSRKQAWLIPAEDRSTLMRTSVFRPPGEGPFPLAVISHGSTQNELQRSQYRAPEYRILTEWLLARGYTVAVPQRPGHGETGGTYYEDQGRCAQADYRKAGLGTASSIAAAIHYLTLQKFVRKTGVLAVGQSAGAWGSLALASQHYPPLQAVVAFAPGRGGKINGEANSNCAPDKLVAVARQFGEKTRIRSLWFYAENDSYFGPDLSRRLADAYRLAGGRVEYHLLPALGRDGHNLIHMKEAEPLWSPLLEKFLKSVP